METRRQAEPRPRPFPRFLWIGTAVVLLVLGAASLQSWRDLAAQRAEEARLGAEIERTEARIDELRTRIERLRHDPLTLERLARSELGYVRPGDVVYVYPDDGSGEGSGPGS